MQIQLSAVLRVFDRFQGKPVKSSQVSFYFNGLRIKPLCKPEGYFIFTDIAKGTFSVEIRSKIYELCRFDILIPEGNEGYATANILLNPAQGYPFDRAVTILSGRVQYLGKPVSDSRLYLVRSATAAALKIAQGEAEKDSLQLKLFTDTPATHIMIPGRYLIFDKDRAKREFCMLTGYTDRTGIYALEKGLSFSHSRATPLLEAVECMTDKTGSIFCALESRDKMTTFEISLTAHDDKPSVHPLTLTSGRENRFDTIEI